MNNKNPNKLINEKSPYLLQHAYNPVQWYPWGDEAFAKARSEDKPVFLSVGYSTCHWCHVMAHESFEDTEIAEILNKNFVSIKVDKEERPDIDSIYMSVCQTVTGSGGWPMSIFMTPEQKPFFAGTYFPKTARYGSVGFAQLLEAICDKWQKSREELLRSSEEIMAYLKRKPEAAGEIDETLLPDAVTQLKRMFDKKYGGFGSAPKFPMPHNLLFLMDRFENRGDKEALDMVETTLIQMYKGGIFDHIGYGFSRYSTDLYYLVPHFEKMLYDNALLIMAYAKAFYVTQNPLYKEVAEKTADYVLREMTGPEGGFCSAQDADSEGEEGKFYLFTPEEIIKLLGEDTGARFNAHYGITQTGNFEGRSIPNRLHSGTEGGFEEYLPRLREYRKGRMSLALDDKILTAWNSLMIAALAQLYRVTGKALYLKAAVTALRFIELELSVGDTLFVSFRDGSRSGKGFLDDYAFFVFALLNLYEATLGAGYLEKAQHFCKKAANFYDEENGGFCICGKENERLIISPKETYDGAIPSGNAVMAYNLVRLFHITQDNGFGDWAEKQLAFMSAQARQYPAGHSFYLLALAQHVDPPEHVTVVLKEGTGLERRKEKFGWNTVIKILERPTDDYKLLNGKTTYYVCKNRTCLPPTNEI